MNGRIESFADRIDWVKFAAAGIGALSATGNVQDACEAADCMLVELHKRTDHEGDVQQLHDGIDRLEKEVACGITLANLLRSFLKDLDEGRSGIGLQTMRNEIDRALSYFGQDGHNYIVIPPGCGPRKPIPIR